MASETPAVNDPSPSYDFLQTTQITLPPLEVLRHVVDAHCHPVDASDDAMASLGITVAVMSMTQADQLQVRRLASRHPERIVPFFG
jgi:hypothetical protein